MSLEIWALVEDSRIRELLEELASNEGLTLKYFDNLSPALNTPEPAGGMILALDSGGAYNNYLTIIKRFQKNFTWFDVIVFGEYKTAEIMERERYVGVDLYVHDLSDREEFHLRASHLVSLRRLKSDSGIVGRSAVLEETLATIMQVAPTEVSILIEGESGSGKELTAQAIHIKSHRSAKTFEAVNCGALAEGVLESELFGHERGSFTGAVARRRGLFERADGGTLFLDEVGEMSINMQVKLLRVLESGEFIRVGGIEKLRSDVRIITATNKELESSVERGEFRKDLYYRLKVVRVRIPPLRARQEDIPFLVRYFIKRSSRKHGRSIKGIDNTGLDLLVQHSWPGNVRELANMIDNLTVLCQHQVIRVADVEKRMAENASPQPLPDLPVHVKRSRDQLERELIMNSLLSLHKDVREILELLTRGEGPVPGRWKNWVEVKEAGSENVRDLESLEREMIREALVMNGGNRRKTARQLGLSERTLYRRIKEYGLK
ncbi:MAG: sigma-54-dependent Fis family transcriptional regulator [Candidatus Krumholzibacteriota bacterium]|nr:sigma-54-dependent Fis family transcriptional regulator [Candidatus Krumholzibacteriota bacterium]